MPTVYIDEAGIANNEPISVVVGLIVDDGRQDEVITSLFDEAIARHVPKAYRDGFVFHMTDIFSGNALPRGEWAENARGDLMQEVLSIPRRLGIPVAVGMVRRGSSVPDDTVGMSTSDFQHVMAFWTCLARADRGLREHWAVASSVSAIAENIPSMERYLSAAHSGLRLESFTLPAEYHLQTAQELADNRTPDASEYKCTVISALEFVPKSHSRMLQLADACAFSLRRYFAELKHGDKLACTLLGGLLRLSDWQGPSSSDLFGAPLVSNSRVLYLQPSSFELDF